MTDEEKPPRVVATLHLPLPLEFAGELMRAIGEAGEQFYGTVVARANGDGNVECLVSGRKTWEERLSAGQQPGDDMWPTRRGGGEEDGCLS